MYAFQKYGIEPDIVVLGKGIGNGEPVAVAVGRAEIIDTLNYGEASDTYSGNPRACASILAVLDVYEKVPVVENCRKISPIIEAGLNRLKNDFEFVAFVRGEGLVWGLEVKSYSRKNSSSFLFDQTFSFRKRKSLEGRSASEIANECVYRCYKEGLHLMGPLAEKVLRISPPLIISEEVAQEGLQLMYNAFQKMV
jgi:4-aminobutyrate aminotransferase-like enzyme